MLPSILIVDDEPQVLKSLERLLRSDYRVYTFEDAIEALTFFQNSPTHIVISDLKMPIMDGGEFLKEVARSNGKSKRIALTGYADAELAKKAINDGHISFYINKPWDNTELKATLASLINELRQENQQRNKLKRLATDRRELKLETHSAKVLFELMQERQEDLTLQNSKLKKMNYDMLMLNADLVGLVTGDVFGHSERVAQQARALMKRLGGSQEAQSNIYLAGLLHRVGLVSLPLELQQAHWYELTPQLKQQYMGYFSLSFQILNNSPYLKGCAEIVAATSEKYDGTGWPEHLVAEDIPIGGRILCLLIYFDLMVMGNVTGQPMGPSSACAALELKLGKSFDGKVYREFCNMLASPQSDEVFEIPKLVSSLKPEMELAQDIIDNQQHKLLSEGVTLTAKHIEKLNEIQRMMKTPLVVYVMSHIK